MNFFEVIFGNGRWIYLWHGLEVTIVLTTISLAEKEPFKAIRSDCSL